MYKGPTRDQGHPHGVRLRYVLDLAEIPTFQTLQAEGLPAEPEHPGVRAYLARAAAMLADGLVVEFVIIAIPARRRRILRACGGGPAKELRVSAADLGLPAPCV